MTRTDRIRSIHLDRTAVVYLRQSTLKQVREHQESTRRQYALAERARELGWPSCRIEVVDQDLGRSGASGKWREGFTKLSEEVAHGRVGAIFALEVSRLARSSADWHRLIELCRLADVVLVDERTVYAPGCYDDRLLLGLHGTMSEAEQHWMRLRLEGGRLNKARRGELRFEGPAGYEWDQASKRFRMDPDEEVRTAVSLVFERFRIDGSAYGVMRHFVRNGLRMPARDIPTRSLVWVLPRSTHVCAMLNNPIYAGAYVYGRTEARMGLVDGEIRRRCFRKLPQEQWKVCLRERHPGYIGWEEFMANKRKLQSNRTDRGVADRRGAAREGSALLQGLALCGRCGRRMTVRFTGRGRRNGQYMCIPSNQIDADRTTCWIVSARGVDEAVAALFLEVVRPAEVELGLAVAREAERQADQVDGQWRLRLEQVRYQAQVAERRYKAVDPDNRVVARTLEREWEEALRSVEELERERSRTRRREKTELDDQDRARIVALSRDLPALWRADTTTHAERKNLLRILVDEVALVPVELPQLSTDVRVLWKTGAVSEVTVPRTGAGQGRATPRATVEVIRKLMEAGEDDTHIARALNERELPTIDGGRWEWQRVRTLRYALGWHRESTASRRVPARRGDGLYSIHGIAAEMDVIPGIVRRWVVAGTLQPVVRGGRGRPHWFELNEETRRRLTEAKRRYERTGGRRTESLRVYR